MIKMPWWLVVQPDNKQRVRITFEAATAHEAEAHAREHGGFVVKTQKQVDDFDEAAFRGKQHEPRFSGPIHKHTGPVPKMQPQPPANIAYGQPFPVIDRSSAYASNQQPLEIIDERDEPRSNMLALTERVFSDIMEALENAERPEDV